MPAQATVFVFLSVLAVWCAVFLLIRARRLTVQHDVLSRLGQTEREVSFLRDADRDEDSLENLIAQSGLGWSPEGYWVRTLGGSVVAALFGTVLGGPALAIVLGLFGLVMVPIYVRSARTRRLALLDEQMPRALEIMTMALRAGHPLPRAIAVAAADAPRPIADELRQVVTQHDLGVPVGEVLRRFAERLRSCESVQTFVVAVLVLEKSGGNLIAVIDRIIESARARGQYRARLNALTAEGRSSARVLAMLPPVFGILAAASDPGFMRVLGGTASGRVLLVIVIAMWLGGLAWVRRIVRPEV